MMDGREGGREKREGGREGGRRGREGGWEGGEGERTVRKCISSPCTKYRDPPPLPPVPQRNKIKPAHIYLPAGFTTTSRIVLHTVYREGIVIFHQPEKVPPLHIYS